ncbi:la-related protein Larp4B-like isoform X3 [Physella acuta]|uniref:la-related protein Larp4B-like isoform X3 n=1 Tax=Physella acuta TaxID=109671 RepID=UPI0027DBB26D|nr:la-related protein Larp4B-like isoform X3 [Physella acuta]XP_059169227.1 la-related protein Larp4B-like isoform X3 [Physella acuta]
MMTQDRATVQTMADPFLVQLEPEVITPASVTPASPRNLNPAAQPFRQSHDPTSPKNLNPSAPVFHQSQLGDRSPAEANFVGQELSAQGLLTNGDIQQNGTTFGVSAGGSSASMHRGAGPQPQGSHQMQGLVVQGASQLGGLNMAPQSLLAAGSLPSHPLVAQQLPPQQASYPMAVTDGGQSLRQQQTRIPSQGSSPVVSPAGNGGGEPDSQPNGAGVGASINAVGGDEDVEEDLEQNVIGEGVRYPDSVLEPIRKQMQFYFSAENLPNDKFLNSKMDPDKYIPLDIFLDFNRIKPICSNYEQLAQAVESSSILELNESRNKVRVSQCRKTLTLRGFPATATEEDVRQFILDMGAPTPTHIEFVMVKDKCSTWYVSFKDESIALNSFFLLHNQKADYKGYPIGCCIKSSGTMAAAGYFPSSEESNQRRIAHQNQVTAQAASVSVAAVPAVPNALAQPQQPQPLVHQYSPAVYHSLLPGSPGMYYQQAAANTYMQYMIAPQGWSPQAPAMDPGIIMQSNGLQPQHIRTPNMGRQHMMPSAGGTQNRYNNSGRAQRNNRQTLERSASERPSDRPSVSVGAGNSRSSPRNADGSNSASVVQQGGGYGQRRSRDDGPQMMNPQQIVATQHQYVAHQQQQHVVTTGSAPIVNPAAIEASIQHFQQAQSQQQHPQQLIVPAPMTVPSPVPSIPAPQTSNPPSIAQQQMHHSQPPPPIPVQHHHQPQQPHHHHPQQHQQAHHQQQHAPSQHHPPLALSQAHHQHPQNVHQQQHHHHQPHHNMMPPPHNSQQHQQMPPTQSTHQQHHPQQHQQVPSGNRLDSIKSLAGNKIFKVPMEAESNKRNKRNKREDNVRNQRGGERNPSNRANFSSQAPAAADNFTMEANSFPPLPGAANSITNSEISLESRMSDIVRGGKPRTPASSNSGSQRAPSTTPSPVATPAPAPVISSAVAGSTHSTSATDSQGGDDGDSVADEDATSSSQEEIDTDSISTDTRSVRSEQLPLSSEPLGIPTQSRSQKASTPVATPAIVSGQRQPEVRQGHGQNMVQTRVTQQPPAQLQQQTQALILPSPAASTSAIEAPKPSYAQVAQKNREAANAGNTSENMPIGASLPAANSGTPNGPTSSQNNTTTSGGARSSNQSSNAFREQGNYQGGQQQGPRSVQRGSSKDNMARNEGPPQSSRPPNANRRNSKENRTSNRFEKRKPDTRQK